MKVQIVRFCRRYGEECEMENNGSGRFEFDGFLTSLFYRQMGISKQMKTWNVVIKIGKFRLFVWSARKL